LFPLVPEVPVPEVLEEPVPEVPIPVPLEPLPEFPEADLELLEPAFPVPAPVVPLPVPQSLLFILEAIDDMFLAFAAFCRSFNISV